MPAAEFAGDVLADVLRSDSQFFVAMRTVDIERLRPNARTRDVEMELTAAVLTRDGHACVLLVNAQLFLAMRTLDVIPGDRCFNHVADLLQIEVLGNDHFALDEGLIQQAPAVLAMHQILWHVLTTIRTWATGPCGHFATLRRLCQPAILRTVNWCGIEGH